MMTWRKPMHEPKYRVKGLDSVISGHDDNGVDESFFKLVKFFVPPPARILDPCAGTQIFHKKLKNSFLDSESYELVLGDVKNLHGLTYVGDMRKLSDNPILKPESFDLIIFDPPFGVQAGSRDKRISEYGFALFTPAYLKELMFAAGKEFPRLLKPRGWLITKMMSQHEKFYYKPWQIWLHNVLCGCLFGDRGEGPFKCQDEMLYRYWHDHYFTNDGLLNKKHCHYQIFRKKERVGI